MKTILALFALISVNSHADGFDSRQHRYDWMMYQQMQEQTRIQQQIQNQMEQERLHRITEQNIRLMSGAFPGGGYGSGYNFGLPLDLDRE